MKFTKAAINSLRFSSFLRATALLATLFMTNVDGQVQLSLGVAHSCAFEPSSASLKCWGYNQYYQLNTGVGDNANRLTPIIVLFQGISTLAGAEAGGLNTCGIDDDGGVKCVGQNEYGELGIGNTITPISTPTSMNTLSEKVVKVSVGRFHACVIYIGGGMGCTGKNNVGQLGLNDTTDRSTPSGVSLVDEEAKDVGVGWEHSCLQTIEDSLLCMGLNNQGQLGLGDKTDRHTPVKVSLSGNKSVLTFSVGGFHSCVIDIENLVQCWGDNNDGQLGVGHNNDEVSPTMVTSQGNEADKISAGKWHTCYKRMDTSIWCMGYNASGQLGNGSTTSHNTPVQVNLPALVTPVDITLGNYHSCITTDIIDEIYCWGQGGDGQLGNGSTANKSSPTLVQSLDFPTLAPVPATSSPTKKPTKAPTLSTSSPTKKPTASPTKKPTASPTKKPTASPTKKPTPSPSEAPIVSLYATAVCGGASFKCKPQSEVAPKTATYGIRCCNDTVFPASLKKPGCSVYGGSRVGNPRGCVKSATFQEAVDYCAASGARLCTKKELLDKCAKSTGCGLNRVLVWSSEPAVAP